MQPVKKPGSSGPRPHTWKVQGQIPHQQHRAWQQSQAQARYRGEPWSLTFEQYQQVWSDNWHLRGRTSNSLCLVRIDFEQGWTIDNTTLMQRQQHLKRDRPRRR